MVYKVLRLKRRTKGVADAGSVNGMQEGILRLGY